MLWPLKIQFNSLCCTGVMEDISLVKILKTKQNTLLGSILRLCLIIDQYCLISVHIMIQQMHAETTESQSKG